MDRESARALTRLQIALWLPASCQQCDREYESVDDFLDRNPRAGYDRDEAGGPTFVDDACWSAYEAEHPEAPSHLEGERE